MVGYDVSRHMMFLSFEICCLITFVALRHLSPIMTFVAYRVCRTIEYLDQLTAYMYHCKKNRKNGGINYRAFYFLFFARFVFLLQFLYFLELNLNFLLYGAPFVYWFSEAAFVYFFGYKINNLKNVVYFFLERTVCWWPVA